jgi:sulfofructose kinase
MNGRPSVRVICVGVATLDQIFRIDRLPVPPAKIQAQEFIVTGGGMAANAAVTVARLGGRAAWWGRLGDDGVGDQILRLLEAEGVAIRVVRLPGARSKTAAILVDAAGERLVVSAPAQGYPPDTGWLPLTEVAGADAVHADSRWRTGALALFDAAAATGKPSVFDGDSGDPEEILRLSRAATHPFLSEPMLARYDPNPETAVRRIFGGRNVAAGVTLGGAGVLWFDGSTLHRSPAFKVPVVDTLAAGDTWHGALALALGEGQSVDAAIRFATAAAALKCTRFGGRVGIPSRDELDAFLAGH